MRLPMFRHPDKSVCCMLYSVAWSACDAHSIGEDKSAEFCGGVQEKAQGCLKCGEGQCTWHIIFRTSYRHITTS